MFAPGAEPETFVETPVFSLSGLSGLYASEVPLRQVLTGRSSFTRGTRSHVPCTRASPLSRLAQAAGPKVRLGFGRLEVKSATKALPCSGPRCTLNVYSFGKRHRPPGATRITVSLIADATRGELRGEYIKFCVHRIA